ncbi:MAG: TrkA family potassium uptake protein [bacterium]|nr:TrkA family potassium uptake protein [bacterium]
MIVVERKKFAVIGLGKFGLKLVEEFSKMGLEVIAIDKDSLQIDKVRDIASESIILDALNKEFLEKTGVKEVDSVVVAVGGEIEDSILITALLKEIGAKEIISRAENSLHAKILKKVGADMVISPEEDMAVRLAHTIHFPGVQEYVDMKGPWDLAEFKILQGSKLIGKKIGKIRKEITGEVSILMVEKVKGKIFNHQKDEEREERESIIPKDDYIIRENDILILFAKPGSLKKFIKKIS